MGATKTTGRLGQITPNARSSPGEDHMSYVSAWQSRRRTCISQGQSGRFPNPHSHTTLPHTPTSPRLYDGMSLSMTVHAKAHTGTAHGLCWLISTTPTHTRWTLAASNGWPSTSTGSAINCAPPSWGSIGHKDRDCTTNSAAPRTQARLARLIVRDHAPAHATKSPRLRLTPKMESAEHPIPKGAPMPNDAGTT